MKSEAIKFLKVYRKQIKEWLADNEQKYGKNNNDIPHYRINQEYLTGCLDTVNVVLKNFKKLADTGKAC